MGDKWSFLLIRDMGLFGKHRNKDFQEGAEGIPSNVLASRLKKLLEAGLIEKRLYQDRPPRYEYHLTAAGLELVPIVREMALWAHRNVAGVKLPSMVASNSPSSARATGT